MEGKWNELRQALIDLGIVLLEGTELPVRTSGDLQAQMGFAAVNIDAHLFTPIVVITLFTPVTKTDVELMQLVEPVIEGLHPRVDVIAAQRGDTFTVDGGRGGAQAYLTFDITVRAI